MEPAPDNAPGRVRRIVLSGFFLFFVLVFLALGVWQIQRRSWKLALIRDVDQRVHAVATPAPGPADWPRLTVAGDRYRHIVATGRFLPDLDTETQAVTELGGGFWLMTPFLTDAGYTILINRGFMPPDMPVSKPPSGEQRIVGLLRFSEPTGGFLRTNDPASGRWYSRDVQAIAAARRLQSVAPYFMDRDADGAEGYPRGGLTVIRFPNNHLTYALTWFALAGLSAFGLARAWRD